jgi:multidrug resistance efflux pump
MIPAMSASALPQPRAADTDLLAVELGWPGAATQAALREAAAAIRDADLEPFVDGAERGWLSRLFRLDGRYRRARRRTLQAIATLEAVMPRLRDGLALHNAFLQRSEAAAARCRATERDLAAALATAEAGAGEERERALHDLRLALAVARQDSLTAALLLDRDRGIAQAIRTLLEDTLPRWHAMVAEALTLRRAASARRLLQALAAEEAEAGSSVALRDIDALVAQIGTTPG